MRDIFFKRVISKSEYIITFSTLSEGNHQLIYLIDNEFFASFEDSLIERGKIKITLDINKSGEVCIFEFTIDGTVNVECDRCLDTFDLKIFAVETMYIKTGEPESSDIENVIYISKDDNQLDLKQYIYENILINIPYRKVHPDNERGESTCNREMLEQLEKHLVKTSDNTDPRWDKLKDLLN